MAGKVCLSEFALDVCDDGMGNCLIAVLPPTVLHHCCTHLWAYTIHPLLQYNIGTTGKGYSTNHRTTAQSLVQFSSPMYRTVYFIL